MQIGSIVLNCFVDIHPLNESLWTAQTFSLIPVILMSVLCCSLFLLGPKWLIIEPNCPQSLKIIYQVLKFAWKHKTPLNRSAFTYWEENIPSRLDLGKTRYGGPFTTEQVEDVKTFFKIIVIFLPMSLTSCSFYPTSVTLLSSDLINTCDISLVPSSFVMAAALLVYEFVVYPMARNRIPSILKRLGLISFLALLFNIVKIVLIFVYPAHLSTGYRLLYSVPLSGVFVFIIMTFLEFVCAQSPYKMRGLLLGYVVFLYIISLTINITAAYICKKFSCHSGILESVFTALSLVGFVVYCLLARWYKMRVRDEEYNVHRVVEEVYDRYLSQRP